MCYSSNRDFGRDIRKDAGRKPEEKPAPRAKPAGFKFWAFPQRHRDVPATAPEPRAEAARERV